MKAIAQDEYGTSEVLSLREIDPPVAGDDELVAAQGSRELAAGLAPGIGTLHLYDGLYHEIFNEREPDRARVLGDLTAWLEQQLSR